MGQLFVFAVVPFSILCIFWMVALLAGQGAYAMLYCRRLAAQPDTTREDQVWQPKVAIVLCVRGADPSLDDCLNALGRQQWPDYEIIIGLDSLSDPAWENVDRFRNSSKHKVHVYVLDKVNPNCSLKCSLLTEIVGSLDPKFEVIALVDADSVVNTNWLELLVTPLSAPSTGAVSGTRWCEPPPESGHFWGTYARAVWNTAAIVQMHLYSIVWGGSLAMRVDTVRKLGLLEKWGQQLCEDTCITGELKRAGLRLSRPRELLAINNETARLSDVGPWITRQLLTVRLYDRHWPLVAAHGLLVGIITPATMIALVLLAIQANWVWLAAGAGTYVLYTIGSWWMLAMVSRANQEVIARQSSVLTPDAAPGQPSIIAHRVQWLLAIPVTQIVHLIATVRAIFARQIEWRGIRYDLARGSIRIHEYRQFENTDDDSDHSVH